MDAKMNQDQYVILVYFFTSPLFLITRFIIQDHTNRGCADYMVRCDVFLQYTLIHRCLIMRCRIIHLRNNLLQQGTVYIEKHINAGSCYLQCHVPILAPAKGIITQDDQTELLPCQNYIPLQTLRSSQITPKILSLKLIIYCNVCFRFFSAPARI